MRMDRRSIGAVAIGGALGSLARYALSLLWHTTFPWTTLVINVTGSAILGALLAWIALTPGANPLLRPFIGTGILGGYTTFSTFTVETRNLIAAESTGLAATYVVVTVIAAVTAAAGSEWLVRRWLSPR
jgi:CrcB protein